MDSNDKKRFIRDLAANVADELVNKVAQMPEEWDGLELRELMAAKFLDSCLMRHRKADYRRRFREYENEVIVRNL